MVFSADHPWLQNFKQAPEVSLGEVVRSRLKHFSAMNKLKTKALRVSRFTMPFVLALADSLDHSL